jgi:hypothetical protein
MEANEKKCEQDIRRHLKAGQKGAAQVMAKQLVSSRKSVISFSEIDIDCAVLTAIIIQKPSDTFVYEDCGSELIDTNPGKGSVSMDLSRMVC